MSLLTMTAISNDICHFKSTFFNATFKVYFYDLSINKFHLRVQMASLFWDVPKEKRLNCLVAVDVGALK